MLLAACGGGGGGDDDPAPTTDVPIADNPMAVVEAPVDDPAPVETLPDASAAPETEPAEGPVAQTSDPETAPGQQPESVPDPAPRPDPVAPATDPIESLFGRVTIDYSFGGSERVAVFATFDAGDRAVIGGNDSVQVADARATLTDGGEPIDTGAVLPLLCSWIPDVERLFCLLATGDALTVFAFERPQGDGATGTFAFCPAGTPAGQCGRQLALAPNGTATLSVDRAAARVSATGSTGIDLAPYLAYAAQGAPALEAAAAADPDVASAASTAIEAAVAR